MVKLPEVARLGVEHPLIGYDDVQEAAVRIAGKLNRTPAVHIDAISRLVGVEVWLKLDTLQITGAFEDRGAANRLARPTPRRVRLVSRPCPPATTPRL